MSKVAIATNIIGNDTEENKFLEELSEAIESLQARIQELVLLKSAVSGKRCEYLPHLFMDYMVEICFKNQMCGNDIGNDWIEPDELRRLWLNPVEYYANKYHSDDLAKVHKYLEWAAKGWGRCMGFTVKGKQCRNRATGTYGSGTPFHNFQEGVSDRCELHQDKIGCEE